MTDLNKIANEQVEIIHHEENDNQVLGTVHAEYWEASYGELVGIGKTEKEAMDNLMGNIESH